MYGQNIYLIILALNPDVDWNFLSSHYLRRLYIFCHYHIRPLRRQSTPR